MKLNKLRILLLLPLGVIEAVLLLAAFISAAALYFADELLELANKLPGFDWYFNPWRNKS